MPIYVALLRAVNVGGTGKLPMKELVLLCQDAGFTEVTTYIQSGNVVLSSRKNARGVKAALEKALAAKMGKPVGVLVRTAAELRAVADANPFPDAAPSQVLTLFLDDPPPQSALDAVVIPGREQLRLRGREIYVHFPDGMGRSRLKVPFQDVGTGRNLNTVRKLVELSG